MSKQKIKLGKPRLKGRGYAQIKPIVTGSPLRKDFRYVDSGSMRGANILWVEDDLGNLLEIHYRPTGSGASADKGEWWLVTEPRQAPEVGAVVDDRYNVIGERP